MKPRATQQAPGGRDVVAHGDDSNRVAGPRAGGAAPPHGRGSAGRGDEDARRRGDRAALAQAEYALEIEAEHAELPCEVVELAVVDQQDVGVIVLGHGASALESRRGPWDGRPPLVRGMRRAAS